jgi:hypothetical protein
MAARFLDLPNGQIREGRFNKGFQGKDFSSRAFFSDRAIVVFGVSKSQTQGELAVIEGKFKYPGGRATGAISSYTSVGLFTEEEKNEMSPVGNAGGFAWRYKIPPGTDIEISDLYSSSISQNAVRVQLSPISINQKPAGIASDIRSSISRGLGRRFTKKYGKIAIDWISDPYSFSIRKADALGRKSRYRVQKSFKDEGSMYSDTKSLTDPVTGIEIGAKEKGRYSMNTEGKIKNGRRQESLMGETGYTYESQDAWLDISSSFMPTGIKDSLTVGRNNLFNSRNSLSITEGSIVDTLFS